tara:strand:- start:17 stop:223 length:207 start_codon:yes stop_codon:yes gene_type:complete
MEKSKNFQMRVSEDWLSQIDDWRRHQDDLPSRAEAIRRLIEQGLKAEAEIKRLQKALKTYEGVMKAKE